MNRFIEGISPYKTVQCDIWKNVESIDDSVLKLDWNEATIPPSKLVVSRIINAANDGRMYSLYPMLDNIELKKKISMYVGVDLNEVQYYPSSDRIHECVVRTLINPGDVVVILWPSYDNFRATAAYAGADIRFAEMPSLKFDIKEFEKTIERNNPKLIYICNPINPTGELISQEDIVYLLEKFSEIFFMIDEAYVEFSGGSIVDKVKSYKKLLVSRTFSKAFALANFRVGYLVAHPEVLNQVDIVRNPKNISSFSQIAADAALDDITYMRNYVDKVRMARNYFTTEMKKLLIVDKVYDSSTNFVLVSFINKNIKEELFEYLKKERIYVRTLNQSEMLNNSLRFTIGIIEEMIRVVDVIKGFGER